MHRDLDQLSAATMDAVQKARSGHPWTPMALAPTGMRTFGASAPLEAPRTRFGLTPEAIVSSALLARGEG